MLHSYSSQHFFVGTIALILLQHFLKFTTPLILLQHFLTCTCTVLLHSYCPSTILQVLPHSYFSQTFHITPNKFHKRLLNCLCTRTTASIALILHKPQHKASRQIMSQLLTVCLCPTLTIPNVFQDGTGNPSHAFLSFSHEMCQQLSIWCDETPLFFYYRPYSCSV
jgi:hypothetical protein